MPLSTVYLYKTQFPQATETDAQITNALNISTSFLENYFDRKLESATHVEYYNGTDNNAFFAHEWPITAVIDLMYSQESALRVEVLPAIYDARISSNASSITIITRSLTGVEATNVYSYSVYTNWSLMNTAIDGDGNLTSTIQTSDSNDLTMFTVPINISVHANNSGDILTWTKDELNYVIDPETNRYIVVDNNLSYSPAKIYFKYTAGYIFPVDNAGHTALTTSGTVPKDLEALCNNLVYIVLDMMINGIKSGGYSAESLGDYSYSIGNWGGKPLSPITSFIIMYGEILDRYKRKSFPR